MLTTLALPRFHALCSLTRRLTGWFTTVLAPRAHAPDSCQLRDCRAGSVKAVFACTFTRQLVRCGCPAVTDGLDGFCPPRTISAAGAWTSPRLIPVTAVRQKRPEVRCFRARRPALAPP